MSRARIGGRRDAAAIVLASMAPLLPAARREWGQAMQAELDGVDPTVDRWRFVGGCALAIVSRPALGAAVSLGVLLGIVIATVLLTAGTAYLPMHIGLIAMVSVLGALYLVGDRAVFFDVGATGSRLAAAVRASGALALAWVALDIVLSFRSGDGNVVDRASTGVPIVTVLLALYLVGFMSQTSHALADRWVLIRGVGFGVTSALVWLVMVLARASLPLSSRSAAAILAVAIVAAAVVGAPRGKAVSAALSTGLVGALSIFVAAHLVLTYSPPGWIPSDTAALTPAARLAQSRAEAGDGYLQLFLVGVLAAIAVLVRAFRSDRQPQHHLADRARPPSPS